MIVMNDKYISKGIIRTDEYGNNTYKVVDQTTGVNYCLKVFNHSCQPSEREQIQLEFQTLKQLDHPTIVRCHDIWEMADGKIQILLDYIGNEHVNVTYLSKDETQLPHIAHQLLLGLDYLHSKNMWHGNIKKSNVFVDVRTNQLRVFYFGKTLSRVPLHDTDLEVINGYDNFYWDIWNLGFMILKSYMGTREKDESLSSGKRTKRKRTDDINVNSKVLNSSENLWNFLRCCMQTQVSNRWNTTRLLTHPFIHRNSGSSSLQKRSHSSPSTSVDVSIISTLDISSKTANQIPDKKTKLSIGYTTEDEKNSSSATVGHDYGPTYGIFNRNDSQFPISFEMNVDRFDPYDKCIQHFSLFPQDFEFDMDKVVQLWIAEGCIHEEERMEDVAKSYFVDLVEEGFIIPEKLDKIYGNMVYKLNISRFSNWSQTNGRVGDYLRVGEINMDEILRATATRHLSFHCTRFDPKVFEALRDYKQLRTLILPSHPGCQINLLPNAFVLGLKSLRTLDLSFTSISELPSAIGNLESLRCLDVSETPIRQLPESTDRLSFLQTVRLRGCGGVRSLPKKLEKLINLRHLDLDILRQLKSMPKRIRSLIKLQTLHAFLVGNDEGCGIGELENLNNITGSFCISGLENVLSLDEAKKAMLGNKKHLVKLELRWSDHINENSLIDVEILECLQPHFGIKELKILCYKGSKLPCWISNPSFTNLANISLYKCLNCNILPSIGELPSLRSLTIVEMNSLTDIDSIFCRNYGTLGSGAFRSLEKLTLDSMLSLEKWTGLENGDFACLRHMAIRYCPKLTILPVLSHLTSLSYFEISHCSQLISLPERGMPSSLETLIVRACPNINEGCIKDEQDRGWIAHVANIWIDLKKISLD